MEGYVYYLADPRTPRWPRYVGSTKDPEARARGHAKRSAGNPLLQAWKDGLRADGLLPSLVVLAAFPMRDAALSAEWRLIGRWRRRGLCDLNCGREGSDERWSLMVAHYHIPASLAETT